MKKNGKDAKYTFGADGIFLCKDDDNNVIGLAWYSHLDEDITLHDGETIRKDKYVEESIAI